MPFRFLGGHPVCLKDKAIRTWLFPPQRRLPLQQWNLSRCMYTFFFRSAEKFTFLKFRVRQSSDDVPLDAHCLPVQGRIRDFHWGGGGKRLCALRAKPEVPYGRPGGSVQRSLNDPVLREILHLRYVWLFTCACSRQVFRYHKLGLGIGLGS